MEVEKGWSLYAADDKGVLAAMFALHLPDRYLDQLFVAPAYQGSGLGRRLLAFTRHQMPDEIWLRCVRENEKAWRWYEREGFGSGLNFAVRLFKMLPSRPSFDTYIDRCVARPAFQRAEKMAAG